MTGQSKKAQQRSTKNTSNNKSAKKNIRLGSDNSDKKIPASSTEVKELKQKVAEFQLERNSNNLFLQTKITTLERENSDLRSKNDELTNQNILLRAQINNNEFLQSYVDEENSDDAQPVKKQTKRKLAEDDDGAKILMKALLKTYSSEFTLRDEYTFKDPVNTEICQKLIPKIQKDIKQTYNLSYEQVESLLQPIHRTKRTAYLKSNQSDQLIPADDESDGPTRPAKRQMKSKVKKSGYDSEDEEDVKIEEGAKSLIKAFLKTYSPEFILRDEYTFKDPVNTEICQKLIPKIQKDIKSTYNLSYAQVENWLQVLHRGKRHAYLKSNQMMIDDY